MPTSSHPTAVVAAVASASAGLIHAAAAGSHAELPTLAALFSITAVVQIGWALAVAVRPEPAVLTTGIGINLAALGAWVTSRTVGIGAVEGLEAGQAVGFADGLAASLAGLAVIGAAGSFDGLRLPPVVRTAVPAVIALVALATVPAMATPHDHDHDHAATAAAATPAGDAGDDHHGHDHVDGHDHGTSASEPEPTLTEAELGYPVSFVEWLDQAPTPEARDRAEQLILETTEAMRAFPDEAAVQAAGFISIGDGATGWEHYINIERIADPRVLDPDDIESIVLKVNPDGTKEVASAMYLLPFGTTMDDVPDVAGDLTVWHDHQNLCWEGARVVGTTDATGSCQRGEFRPTQPMMHVWVMEHPCGPFAGIEGSHGGGCDHHDH